MANETRPAPELDVEPTENGRWVGVLRAPQAAALRPPHGQPKRKGPRSAAARRRHRGAYCGTAVTRRCTRSRRQHDRCTPSTRTKGSVGLRDSSRVDGGPVGAGLDARLSSSVGIVWSAAHAPPLAALSDERCRVGVDRGRVVSCLKLSVWSPRGVALGRSRRAAGRSSLSGLMRCSGERW
jgi:hypothetical protein